MTTQPDTTPRDFGDYDTTIAYFGYFRPRTCRGSAKLVTSFKETGAADAGN